MMKLPIRPTTTTTTRPQRRRQLALLLLLLLLLSTTTTAVQASCATDRDCGEGSTCRKGLCSNPYASGCFHHYYYYSQQQNSNNHNTTTNATTNATTTTTPPPPLLRVCNSEDDINSQICRQSDFADYYTEIRLFADNWESATYAAWILQIVLSELLQVPTTIETGSPTAAASFYHPESLVQYGASNEMEVLSNGQRFRDCRLVQQQQNYNKNNHHNTTDNHQNYTPCGHAMLESWVTETVWANLDAAQRAVVEPEQTNGLLGQLAWFVTKFTALQDAATVSYFGLANKTRRELAQLFLRPTTWNDYCHQESATHCQTPDATAVRAPRTPAEGDHYFVPGLYTGYFRATAENDCDRFPHNCTGHVADFPCGWSSTVEAQAHHLGLALASSGPDGPARGYPYHHLQQIWYAANATKSNVLLYWWYPEPLYHEFEGTDAEFTHVTMPTPTRECYQHKVNNADRCAPDQATRVGTAAGVCESLPDLLDKAWTASLYELTHNPELPTAVWSPAYDAIRAFSLDNLQLGQLLRQTAAAEPSNPRAAVCEWVVEHRDTVVAAMVPPTFPRVLDRPFETFNPMILFCTFIGGVTGWLVAIMVLAVILLRRKRAVALAQVEFLLMILAGAFLLTMGALLIAAPPTAIACLTAPWLTSIGFTLQLVPLMVKMTAIHRMIAAAKKMRRVVLQRKNLFWAVASVVGVLSAFLVVWTVVDPSVLEREYQLTDQMDLSGATIVTGSDYCASQHSWWEYVVVGWESILLLCSSVIAYQTRHLDPKFNESRTLALLIYSHASFVLLRLVVLGLRGRITEIYLRRLESVVLSADTLAGLLIYFVPIIALARDEDPRDRRQSVHSTFAGRSDLVVSSWHDGSSTHHHHPALTRMGPMTNPVGGKLSLQHQISAAKRQAESFDELSSSSSSSSSDRAGAAVPDRPAVECPACGQQLRQRRRGPQLHNQEQPRLDLSQDMALSDVEDNIKSTEPSTEFHPNDDDDCWETSDQSRFL